jgi:hypothetical protein
VDALALHQCKDYNQYGAWLIGQFSDFLPKEVASLVGPTHLNINSLAQEAACRLMAPEGYLNLLGQDLYDAYRAELTELSMILCFMHETSFPCPFTRYLDFRQNEYPVYSAEFCHSDFMGIVLDEPPDDPAYDVLPPPLEPEDVLPPALEPEAAPAYRQVSKHQPSDASVGSVASSVRSNRSAYRRKARTGKVSFKSFNQSHREAYEYRAGNPAMPSDMSATSSTKLRYANEAREEKERFLAAQVQDAYPTPDPEDYPELLNHGHGGDDPFDSGSMSPSRHDRVHRMKSARCRSKLGEKVKWDGLKSSFKEYSQVLAGHLLQVGAGYLVSTGFVRNYLEQGAAYFKTDEFWYAHFTSEAQALSDRNALYGLLLSSNKPDQQILLKYEDSQDGIRAWAKFQTEWAHDGSKALRVEVLEELVLV